MPQNVRVVQIQHAQMRISNVGIPIIPHEVGIGKGGEGWEGLQREESVEGEEEEDGWVGSNG
jgi:hypothetical protein